MLQVTLYNSSSIAERRTDKNALVWTQMVKQIAQKDIGHVSNRAPFLGTVVPAARVPTAGSFDMNLSTDVAVSHPASRHDGDRVRIVVYAFEVSVHLCL